MSFPIAWSCMFTSLWMDGLAVIIFIIGHAAGVMITRCDPHMIELYLKHIKYKRYYLGQPTIYSRLQPVRGSVPVYLGKGEMV